jgi:hypothetical protein
MITMHAQGQLERGSCTSTQPYTASVVPRPRLPEISSCKCGGTVNPLELWISTIGRKEPCRTQSLPIVSWRCSRTCRPWSLASILILHYYQLNIIVTIRGMRSVVLPLFHFHLIQLVGGARSHTVLALRCIYAGSQRRPRNVCDDWGCC